MNKLSRRQAAARLAGLLTLGWATSAHALVDLLKIPARASTKAPKSLLLGITQAGPRLVAVGERGIIVWSDDGGQRWQQAQVPVSVTLTAVAFADAKRGWAVGHDGAILHSSDAGQTWALQFDGLRANAAVLARLEAALQAATSPEQREQAELAVADLKDATSFGPSRPMLSVCVQKSPVGERLWVAGAFGQLFTSTDGGKAWVDAAAAIANPDGLHFNQITALTDTMLAIACEAGKVILSRDAGRSWAVRDTGYNGHLYGVLSGQTTGQGPGPGPLLAYGFGGHLFASSDDGATWQATPSPTKQTLIGGLRLANGVLLLVDRERHVLASSDGGKTWSVTQAPAGLPLAGVSSVPSPGRLAVAGVGGASLIALNLP